MNMKIVTAHGNKFIARRVGAAFEYVQDTEGHWWTLNPQRGWAPVPSNSRGLLAAIQDCFRVQP